MHQVDDRVGVPGCDVRPELGTATPDRQQEDADARAGAEGQVGVVADEHASENTQDGTRRQPGCRQLGKPLVPHRAAQAGRGTVIAPASPVIVTEAGTRVAPDMMEKWWRRDRNALGAGNYCLHELRHSYLTQLARAGVHPKVMQELAGHANSAITMDIYTHTDMGAKFEAAEALKNSLA